MKLTKIHRVLKFKQSDWVKKDINFYTEKSVNVANDFEKDFIELIINSVYGKIMENLRKRINVRLVNKVEIFLKYTSKPTYITHKDFGKDYAAIHQIKPVLIPCTALDLSKWQIYDFHYNFIKKNFDAKLLFTDTDSLTYEKCFKLKDLFDFSNYSKYYSKDFYETNKKVIGKMKDGFGGVIC